MDRSPVLASKTGRSKAIMKDLKGPIANFFGGF